MGQKINPIGLRVGINKTWDSRWFAEGDYATKLHEDYRIRKCLKKSLDAAGVSRIDLARAGSICRYSRATSACRMRDTPDFDAMPSAWRTFSKLGEKPCACQCSLT